MTPTKVSLSRVAVILNVTEQEIMRLSANGILKRETIKHRGHQRMAFDWEKCVHAFLEHMTRRATQAKEDYALEKAETQRIIREQKELELAVARGDMVQKRMVTLVMTGLLSTTKNHVLAIASKVSHALVGLTDRRVAHKLVSAECERALRELTEFEPEQVFEKANAKNGHRKAIATKAH